MIDGNHRYWLIDMQATSEHPMGTWVENPRPYKDMQEAVIDGWVIVVATGDSPELVSHNA